MPVTDMCAALLGRSLTRRGQNDTWQVAPYFLRAGGRAPVSPFSSRLSRRSRRRTTGAHSRRATTSGLLTWWWKSGCFPWTTFALFQWGEASSASLSRAAQSLCACTAADRARRTARLPCSCSWRATSTGARDTRPMKTTHRCSGGWPPSTSPLHPNAATAAWSGASLTASCRACGNSASSSTTGSDVSPETPRSSSGAAAPSLAQAGPRLSPSCPLPSKFLPRSCLHRTQACTFTTPSSIALCAWHIRNCTVLCTV